MDACHPATMHSPSDVPPGVRFASRVFRIAAIYGLIVLVPQYFMEGKIGRDTPPPITHAEYFYGFVGVALAWQPAFLLIARDARDATRGDTTTRGG